MTLKCGENKKVAHKVQLSMSLMLETMQYGQHKLITIKYVYKFCSHLFFRLSIDFRAFPLDEDNLKIMF